MEKRILINRETVAYILDAFEDFLDEKDVIIPNKKRDEDDPNNSANLYEEDWDNLFEAVISALNKEGIEVAETYEEVKKPLLLEAPKPGACKFIKTQDGYITMTHFNRTDIEEVLNYEGIPGTTKNIDRYIDFQKAIFDEHYDYGEEINTTGVEFCIEAPTIDELVHEDEELVKFYLDISPYTPYYFIRRKGSTDIAGNIEETLHKLIEAGFSDEKIEATLGAKKIEEIDEDNSIYIDLDYVIPNGIIMESPMKEGE
ncbi:MAG: hypothetical protein K6G00_00565 [Treponema sp.]|nr:hypothetical protein [Treponema sp.]